MRYILSLLLFTLGACSSQKNSQTHQYDVVVYTATPCGIMAAIAAAKEGRSVALIEPEKHVGGMVSSGLGWSDYGKPDLGKIIGGLPMEFFDRVSDYYGREKTRAFNAGLDIKLHGNPELGDNGWYFEPHVAEKVFMQMLKDAGVEIYFSQRLSAKNGVEKIGNQLTAIITEKGSRIEGKVFIDAGYEGDLMAQAGVSYTLGREANKKYNEPLAGVLAAHRTTGLNHDLEQGMGYKIFGFDKNGKLLPGMNAGPREGEGEGDDKIQAYNFRLCLSGNKNNQVPFTKPAGYDRSQYEVLARILAYKTSARQPIKLDQILKNSPMPGEKTDTNNQGPFSTDYVNESWSYPESDYATRKRIYNKHVTYTRGLLYFLSTDSSVPLSVQQEMKQWGYAKDEFADNDNWPYQLYIREGRRMVSDYVFVQKDVQTDIKKNDAIGMGSYAADSHIIQRRVNPDGLVENEGQMFENIVTKPYQIPYKILIPKSEQAKNLLVGICVSSSHVAYQTLRMEPQYMIIGQAAGTAAALAIAGNKSVQEIDVSMLKNKLTKNKAVLNW